MTRSHTYCFKLVNLLFSMEVTKLNEEAVWGGELTRLKEIQETEQLLYIVLQRCARQQNLVFLEETKCNLKYNPSQFCHYHNITSPSF